MSPSEDKQDKLEVWKDSLEIRASEHAYKKHPMIIVGMFLVLAFVLLSD